MTELPTGTLTFLFSDIEGSTRLVEDLGARWKDVLSEHHRLMRAAIAAHGGTEVGTEGDSFFAVFSTAPSAVAAAIAAQRTIGTRRWPAGSEIRVRMGLHTGTADLAGGSYAGMDVHRAARIMAASHGGQVLLSETTRALVAAEPMDGVTLRDLGEHRLKDLTQPERLYQLVIDDLPAEFPPLRTLDAVPHNLPVQLTSFLGRERELSELSGLVERARLVTLTGPGGTGKTRLALQAAAGLTERFSDGVWFVPLAAISQPELVAPTIAQALALPEHPGRGPLQRLLDHLATKRALLVLDNFEQITRAAPLVGELLTGAPNAAAIVTSRSTLHLSGEHEYPVPPLRLPDLRHLTDLATVSQYEAVALFIERAKAARPDFAVTNETAPAVAEICIRLDGLPLAIELAAARIRVLTPQAILDRLSDRLDLLAGGPRDVPERQRTLRGAIAWSYELLEGRDQRLFACLSVFIGGAGLEAAEAVCKPEVGDVLTGLESLVDNSLVSQTEGSAGRPRFRMLETLREFASEQLRELGRDAEVRRRHGEWYADLAERLAPTIMGPEQRRVLDLLEEEHDNLRSAISWSIQSDRADLALRLTSRLWRMWQMRGHLDEGLKRASAALAMPAAVESPELRADALEAAGGLAYWLGDIPEIKRWYEEALAARRALGDRNAIAEALYNLAFAFAYGKVDIPPEDLERARRLGEEALELFRRQGNASGEARALWQLATVVGFTGDYAAVEEKASRAEAIFRELGDRYYLAWSLWSVGVARVALGRFQEAHAPVRESLQIFAEADDVSGYVGLLDLAATIAFEEGDRERAAILSGGVASLERATGVDAGFYSRSMLGFEPAPLQTAPDTAQRWEDGAAMDRASIIAYAIEGL